MIEVSLSYICPNGNVQFNVEIKRLLKKRPVYISIRLLGNLWENKLLNLLKQLAIFRPVNVKVVNCRGRGIG